MVFLFSFPSFCTGSGHSADRTIIGKPCWFSIGIIKTENSRQHTAAAPAKTLEIAVMYQCLCHVDFAKRVSHSRLKVGGGCSGRRHTCPFIHESHYLVN